MLGIALYPDQTVFEEDIEYLELANRYGYKLVFMSFLQIDINNPKKSVDRIRETIRYANEIGMEVTLDIHPMVFDYIKSTADDLSYFHELGVSTIRLDSGFNGRQEAQMTHNPYNINIEVNMSNETNYLDLIHSYFPDRTKLRGSHNFYPQRYTALSLDSFIRCSRKFQDYHIQSSAFINSNEAKLMPWPVSEGHCTLEIHRGLPIKTQTKHMKMLGMVDNIIIGNAYASESELKDVSDVYNDSMDVLNIEFYDDVTELEKEMILKYKHEYRGDHSEYVIRSSKNRGRYNNCSLPAHERVRDIHRGDILLLNQDYGQYKAEVQIALCDRKGDPRINVVGKIKGEEQILIDYLKPFQCFLFKCEG